MLKSVARQLIFLFVGLLLSLSLAAESTENPSVRLSKLFPEVLEFYAEDSELVVPLIEHRLANIKESIYSPKDPQLVPASYGRVTWDLDLLGKANYQLEASIQKNINKNFSKVPEKQLARGLYFFSLNKTELYSLLNVWQADKPVARWLKSGFVAGKKDAVRKLSWSNRNDTLLLPGLTPASFLNWELEFNQLYLANKTEQEIQVPVLQAVINSSSGSGCKVYQPLLKKEVLAKLEAKKVERSYYLKINQNYSERVVVYRVKDSQRILASFAYDLDNKPVMAMVSLFTNENLPLVNYILRDQNYWKASIKSASFCKGSEADYLKLDPSKI